MKKIVLFIYCVVLNIIVKGQTPTSDSSLTNKYLLNFAVPDMPAFKALGTDPSNILRPSDIQKFAATFSPFYSNGQAVIPKNFALSVAPWKLGSKNWTLGKYNSGANSILYNSSFSLGTINDTTKYPSKLAIGYRLSIVSKNGDILKAAIARRKKRIPEIILQVHNQLKKDLNIVQQVHDIKQKWMLDTNIFNVKIKDSDVSDSMKSPTNAKEFNQFLDLLNQKSFANFKKKYPKVDSANWLQWEISFDSIHNFYTSSQKNILDSVSALMDTLINQFKDSAWNARRFDLALAWVGQSSDSLIKNSEFANFYVWTTLAVPVFKKSQLLVGANAILPRTEKTDSVKTKFTFTGNLRLYVGTSSVRGFIESQFKYQNYDTLQRALLFNLGAEFRLSDSFWVIAGAGINNYLGEKNPLNQFVSSLNIKYAFNKPK